MIGWPSQCVVIGEQLRQSFSIAPPLAKTRGYCGLCVASGGWDQYTLLESDRILTLKVTLLLALTSLKRVGDLQALSVSEMCMEFAPGLVKVTLWPRPGYVPKVLSASFRSQVVTLHSFHPPPFASGEDESLHMLCPVRALKIYVDHSNIWRKSPQLLVCFGAGRHGLTTSKQIISHWVRDVILWPSFTSQRSGAFY